MSQLLIDSPVNPLTDWLPLMFVIVVTALKQAYEDIQRHSNDRQVNLQPIDVVQNGNIAVNNINDINIIGAHVIVIVEF